MATKKGPQIYLNDQDPAEKEIINWADGLGRGRKSTATIETLIVGRSLANVCQPLADLLASAARRGEPMSLEQLEYYISVFKGQVEPKPQEVAKAPEKAVEAQEETQEEETEQEERTGFGDLGA